MKRLIMMGLVLAATAGAANAQTTGSNSTNGTTHSSEGNRRGKAKKAKQKKPANLNHRKIYDWKTGQRATPTGQEATGLGSGYSAIKKDTAGKREERQEQPK